jgi:hypothetical protein
MSSVARTAPQRMSWANAVLSSVALISMDGVASSAEVIGDRTLRSLDAIYLATAHELRAELTAFVCCDKRLRDPAHALGLPVEAPCTASQLAAGAVNSELACPTDGTQTVENIEMPAHNAD